MELDKAYDHSKVEDKIYQHWLDSGFFNPDNLKGEPYTIILPPPNVTGTLHVGHALTATIEDILIRYKRMQGFRTLWLPGTDHAAIATESKVAKLLEKEEGKKKKDLGREEFVKRVEKFAQDSHDTIVNQLKSMGASLDWSREAFTLDDQRKLAVRTAFKNLYDLGLIYRGHRVVNWDVKGQTTISDDEIVYEEKKSKFYTLKYGPFNIGTARPETKFGDKYVVMHPKDKRYKDWKHGQKLTVEWINGPIEATIVKDDMIDMEFGTGVMTITPWHSHEDFALAEKHNLEKQQIIDKFGKLLPIAGEFSGMKISDAREKIVEKLKDKGLLVSVDEGYINRIATAERSGGIIEPQIMEQWFVDVNKKIPTRGNLSLKELMLEAVRGGEIKIVPEHFEKIYFHWIDNLRDWCISRQIWYGHRIPVWYDEQNNIYLPKEKKIIFVRHGESEGNLAKIFGGHIDHKLTDTGKKQAKKSAESLKKYKISSIFSSDLKRAKDTAAIIAEHLGIKNLSAHKELREVFGGELEGQTGQEWGTILIEVLTRNTGETAEQLVDRAQKAWDIINQDKSDDAIVVVGHNSFLAVLKAFYEGKRTKEELIEFRKKWHLTNGNIYEFNILTDPAGAGLTQDEDTLDTWFSSGLWTFSTLGWPEKTSDLQTFHPTDVLETGYDILFFWVARMILMSTALTGQIPFKNVFLHGIIRDADKQKMSKSKGNVIDPLDMTAKYGTDALRFALVFNTAPGTDMAMAEDKIKGMKHFANKLWNIARFVLANKGEGFRVQGVDTDPSTLNPQPSTNADKDIIGKLETLKKTSTDHIENFRLHEAAQEIYHFIWHELADVYIETSKEQLKDEKLKENTLVTLHLSLVTILKLLHPFMPFVTEEIWSKLNQKELLIISKWPKD